MTPCKIHALLAALVFTLAPALDAQPNQKANLEETIAELHERAQQAVGEHDFEQAKRLLTKSFELRPSFDTAASLGDLEYRLGNYMEAYDRLRYAKTHMPRAFEATHAEAIETRLLQVKGELGEFQFQVQPKNAVIQLGDEVLPNHDPHIVKPGTYQVVIRADGYQTKQLTALVKPGTVSVVDLQLPTGKDLMVDAEREERQEVRRHEEVLWIGGAVTLALLGTGVGFAISGKNDRDQLRDLELGENDCVLGASARCARAEDLASSRDGKGAVANWTLAGAAVVGVATAVTYWLWEEEGSVQAAIGPDNAYVRWSCVF